MRADPQPLCSKCGDLMVVKRGPNGAFLGCNAWPKCEHSVTLRQTAAEAKLAGEFQKRRSDNSKRDFLGGLCEEAMYDAFMHDVGDK